jgi:hypothetical protein
MKESMGKEGASQRQNLQQGCPQLRPGRSAFIYNSFDKNKLHGSNGPMPVMEMESQDDPTG